MVAIITPLLISSLMQFAVLKHFKFPAFYLAYIITFQTFIVFVPFNTFHELQHKVQLMNSFFLRQYTLQ
jgi:hypothetical protein